ncbi:MAG: hypothetical protein ABJ275_09930 [Maricaulaceae bacterium]
MFLTFDTVEAFAVKRNPSLSFPFLKENGELISICVNAGFLIEPRALTLYDDFYKNAVKFTQCYPQYYRFTLGMVLDLEQGGYEGNEGQKLTEYVKQKKLIKYDTSDSRKLETLTMLGERGPLSTENYNIYLDILDNVEGFIENPEWYMKFNKPLFYDLTHIIFFLTHYGTKKIPLQNDVYPCLIYMGLLALLDNDADLLSEVCICLDYIGRETPKYWDDFLLASINDIKISYAGTVASSLNRSVDEYHIYLVLNAYFAARNKPIFEHKFKSRTPSFSLPSQTESILSKLSDYTHECNFSYKQKPKTLDFFISTLDDNELSHWQKYMASHELATVLTSKLFC